MSFDANFDLEKRRAAERLREMGARAKFRPAPAQNGAADESKSATEKPPGFLPGTGLPVLSGLNLDSDIMLILGLLLILSAEKSDKLLLLALLYILI